MAVTIGARDGKIDAGTPVKLFEANFRTEGYQGTGVGGLFDANADGSRFLLNVLTGPASIQPSITVTTHWTRALPSR